MKSVTLSALALTVAALGFATSVQAQPAAQAQPARKLFFEGDIVRHALPNQAGPFCVLVNQYKCNEAVAFRIRILQPNGAVADDKVLSAPVIREPIRGGSGQIAGNLTLEDANRVAMLLRAGTLPGRLSVVDRQLIEPDVNAAK